jgi:hypothetical protein
MISSHSAPKESLQLELSDDPGRIDAARPRYSFNSACGRVRPLTSGGADGEESRGTLWLGSSAQGLPVETACRVLGVSSAGYYAWKNRPPSERTIRHAWLTDLVTEIHAASRQTYGSIRIHAEQKLGRGVQVGRNQVELVMRRAGLKGLMGRRRRPRLERPEAVALDLVDRTFLRSQPDELWTSSSSLKEPYARRLLHHWMVATASSANNHQ